MGLFSGKKKKVVNTSMVRLIEDKDIPDAGKTALFDYLYADQTKTNTAIKIDHSYSDYLALQNANSIGNKYNQARVWAKNNYAYGLPKGNVLNKDKVDLVNVMDEFLEKETTRPVRIGYAIFAPLNALHFTWEILAQMYGYNHETNKLQNGAYLHDIQINYCKPTIDNLIDPDTLMQYGLPATYNTTPFRTKDVKRLHTPYVKNDQAEHDFALITTVADVNGKPVYTTFEVDFLMWEWSGYQPTNVLDDSDTENYEPEAITPIVEDTQAEHDYFMVQYTYLDNNNKEVQSHFTYKYGDGVFPDLDRLFNVSKLLGTYNPNMYFRLMGTNLSNDVYKDTNEYKTSKILGNKLGLQWTSISDQLHDSIGSVGDVTQMLLTSALQVNSKDPLIDRYMFDYFYALYNQLPRNFADTNYNSLQSEFVNGFAKIGQTIEIKDKAYSCKLTFSSIGYTDKEGKIGEVGTVTHEFQNKTTIKNKGPFRDMSFIPVHIFRKQMTDTRYRELVIYGLTSTQQVTGGKDTVASGDEENLIVPLDVSIPIGYALKDRMNLYSKSLLFIINTVKVIKTKWYQTGIFKAIMFVVAVIVSIWTGGQGMTVYSVLYAVAQAVVVGAVINIAVKFMVNKLGMNLGGVFAIVAVVLAFIGGAAAISKTGSVMGMTSTQFMQAANYSISISSQSNQLEMIKMGKAHADFMDVMQEKFDKLNELQREMLKIDVLINPAYLMSDSIRGPDIRIGENMSNFIARTLSVDSGLATLDTIPNMVDLTVRLPSTEETLNKIMYNRGEQPWTMT